MTKRKKKKARAHFLLEVRDERINIRAHKTVFKRILAAVCIVVLVIVLFTAVGGSENRIETMEAVQRIIEAFLATVLVNNS